MTNIINEKSVKKIAFMLFFVTVFSILFSTTYAQDDIYPKILSQIPKSSARPNWAGDYLIPGSESETFSVTYNETNMTKVMLFWKEFDNEIYNNITLSNCNPGENETCSVDLNLSMYTNGTVIVYDFVVYDNNSCSLDPLLAEYEEQCGNNTGLPKNCLKGFQSLNSGNVTIETCIHDMYKYPIIEGNLSAPPDTDYLRHVTIDRTPPSTTTTTSTTTLTTSTTTSTTTTIETTIITTTITLEERVRNLEERVSWLETLINLMKEAICSVSPFEGFEFCLDVTPTTTIPTTTTTVPTISISWGHSTCYSTCLKGTDVPYDPCHEYWAVTNLVNRGYCNWM